MRKIALFLVLLFQMTTIAGQQTKEINKKGPTGIPGLQQPKPYIPPASTNTNDQSYQSNCYTGLAFTVKNYGYDKDGKYYSWGIKVKNNYSKAVSLGYRLVVGGEAHQFRTLTYNIKPGETYDNDYGTIRALIVKNSSTQYQIIITEVCFEGQNCIKNGYADCNGKQAGKNNSVSNNIEHKTNSSSGNATNLESAFSEFEHLLLRVPNGSQKMQIYNFVNNAMKSNVSEQSKLNTVNSAIKQLNDLIASSKQNTSTNTQQNAGQQDNTETTNQSQQRMESDMSRGEVRLQPLNQADANRKQQFLNVYNEGIALGNTGKYAEAAAKYQEAIYLSSNAAERQTAQNAYDKVRRGAAQTEAIGQIGTALTSAVNTWQKASEERQLKREAETRALVEQQALQKDQLANYLAANHNYFLEVTTNRNNPEMKKYVEYVIYQFQKAGFSFKEIVRQCFKTEIEKTSRNVTMDFIKGSKVISVIIAFDYQEKYGFFRRKYFVNKDNIDLSNVDLSRITTSIYSINLSEGADPPVIPQNYFKGTSYRGFDKEIELKKENTIEAYTYNALFCHCFDNNVEESVYWNTKAITAGDTESILRLASLYKFYVKDTPMAVYWYNEYFNLKPDSEVAETIGKLYEEAKEPDYFSALLWYKTSAKMGNAKAMLGIGYFYAKGYGVAKDYGEASKWYLQAAEKGLSAGMKSLYNMYNDGGPNLPKNKSEAKKWRKKACEADPKWCKNLK